MDSVRFIADLQQWFAPADAVLRWLSLHSYSHSYLLIAAILYLSGFTNAGARMACATMLSTLIFGSCRQFFASPRPYWDHPELFNGLYEKAWGMPSGHSQNAMVFWSITAYSTGRLWCWGIALCLVASVALSRLFLGLHYPDQVVIGLTIGAVIVTLWIKAEVSFIRWLLQKTFGQQAFWILVLTSLPLFFTMLLHELLGIGPGNGSAIPYKYMMFFTGLFQATGLSLLYVFQKTLISSHPYSFHLVLFRTLPTLVVAIFLWRYRFISLQWFEDNNLNYATLWLHGIILATWVCLIWPCLHHSLIEKRKRDSLTITEAVNNPAQGDKIE